MARYILKDHDEVYQNQRTYDSLDAYFLGKTNEEVSADLEHGYLWVPDLGHSQPADIIVEAKFRDGVWELYNITSIS